MRHQARQLPLPAGSMSMSNCLTGTNPVRAPAPTWDSHGRDLPGEGMAGNGTEGSEDGPNGEPGTRSHRERQGGVDR